MSAGADVLDPALECDESRSLGLAVGRDWLPLCPLMGTAGHWSHVGGGCGLSRWSGEPGALSCRLIPIKV